MLISPTTDRIPHPQDALATFAVAKKWQRAAIVWSYTNDSNGAMTVQEFADLGIVNLTSEQFVTKYRDAWQSVIDRGLSTPLTFGDQIPPIPLGWSQTGNPHMSGCTCGCGTP
ncbi:hypothetical protein [Rhodococcus marinonascens]|uniref:hypothetical protein n=1 Tax=Rhodococcus marinonascens TaxID=38311 RepID=UPI0009350552|nr:hypothetical protein [Rhodococcus marinonascens]